MGPGQDRKRMEERFGEVGTGLVELTIRGKRHDLHQLYYNFPWALSRPDPA